MKIRSVVFILGGLLILAGAASFITGWIGSPIIYTVGAVFFAIPQLMDRYEGPNVIIRRLRRQQIFGALLLLMTSFFMFTGEHNEWVICLAIAAFLELYTSFRLSQEEEKEKKK